ncbi:MAG: ATP synthase F1 subunit gamma [Clostridia bacterium]|nr:ATP synthase F1 subunit gamma [Clostridia bacterium]
MAGTSMNDIKARIKSVESTMQITRAMELVATSKLRRAKERAERTRPYFETVNDCMRRFISSCDSDSSPLLKKKEGGKTLFVVIAGDRGLAGGYNSNIFRLARALAGSAEAAYLPIGKRSLEYFKQKGAEVYCDSAAVAADMGVGDTMELGRVLTHGFLDGDFDRVILVYTKFVSMLSQLPAYEELLPLSPYEDGKKPPAEFEGDIEESFTKIASEYLGGILYSALSESIASEHASRRNAMSSAGNNAKEMIDTLVLKFNRARQAVITREITEIVSGAEAL